MFPTPPFGKRGLFCLYQFALQRVKKVQVPFDPQPLFYSQSPPTPFSSFSPAGHSKNPRTSQNRTRGSSASAMSRGFHWGWARASASSPAVITAAKVSESPNLRGDSP